MRPSLEVAHVLRAHWAAVEHSRLVNSWQLRTLGAVMRCRTADMGGHADACTSCGSMRISYNSCRNRHCPKCQGNKREQWIQAREQELLPVPYFHVVFTLPEELNSLAIHNPSLVYNTLFDAAWDTLQTFARDTRHLSAKTGMISILHTWGQNLSLHPHLHCIVPGGGISDKGHWKTARSDGKYLFPVKAMSKVFRGKFMQLIRTAEKGMDRTLINSLYKKEWVVYAKRPFENTGTVIEYLGRYTHKIAISNHRLLKMDDNSVTFSYKDYRHGDVKKEMTLESLEFIRRFSLHILPRGFVRIRHFGILSSTSKKVTIPAVKEQLPKKSIPVINRKTPVIYDPSVCSCCNTKTVVVIEVFQRRGPPKAILPVVVFQ